MRTIALTIALAAGAAACGPQTADEGDAVLLAVLPYTGKWEDKGLLHENAVRMALEDVIGAGIQDVYGGQLKVLTVNSGDGIDVVETAVRSIVEGPDGEKILGALSSTGDAHEGTAKVALEKGIPHFETSNGASDGEFIDLSAYTPEALQYLLSSRALCNYEAQYTAQFIMEKYPTAKVALLRGNEVHDKMHTSVIRNNLALAGFQGVIIDSADPALQAEADPNNKMDFEVSYDDLNYGGIEAELTQLVAEHDPDLIFFHVRGDGPNLRFLQDLQRSGYDDTIATCGMARTTTLIDPNENGLISDYLVGHDTLDADRFHFIMRGALPSERLDAFKAQYKTRFEMDADTFTPAVYDATMLWALGVVASGSTERAAVLQGIIDSSREGALVSRDDLPGLVSGLSSGSDIDYDGASGQMDVRDDRTVPGYYYIERVIPGESGVYAYEKLSEPAPVVF